MLSTSDEKETRRSHEGECGGAGTFAAAIAAPHFFGSAAYDASIFAKVFPSAKLLGFYAGGEIGPKALAAAPASRATQVGHAAMQGFTAVFGLFMVPQRTRRVAAAHADVAAAYAALRAARAPPPPAAGVLDEQKLRELSAKEVRRYHMHVTAIATAVFAVATAWFFAAALKTASRPPAS